MEIYTYGVFDFLNFKNQNPHKYNFSIINFNFRSLLNNVQLIQIFMKFFFFSIKSFHDFFQSFSIFFSKTEVDFLSIELFKISIRFFSTLYEFIQIGRSLLKHSRQHSQPDACFSILTSSATVLRVKIVDPPIPLQNRKFENFKTDFRVF